MAVKKMKRILALVSVFAFCACGVAFGADGKPVTTETHSYASRLLPTFWVDKDNYKPFLAWCDLISFGSDTSQYLYPSYPAVTDINLYSLDLTPPDYYNSYPSAR